MRTDTLVLGSGEEGSASLLFVSENDAAENRRGKTHTLPRQVPDVTVLDLRAWRDCRRYWDLSRRVITHPWSHTISEQRKRVRRLSMGLSCAKNNIDRHDVIYVWAFSQNPEQNDSKHVVRFFDNSFFPNIFVKYGLNLDRRRNRYKPCPIFTANVFWSIRWNNRLIFK